MSASPERKTIEEILRITEGSPSRESHFMTPTRSILTTPNSSRIRTDPRRVSFSADQTFRVFDDDLDISNMSDESEPSNLFRSVLGEDYNMTSQTRVSLQSTRYEFRSSPHNGDIRTERHTIIPEEKGIQEEVVEEEEEEDDDMRITEQLPSDPSAFYQYHSPKRARLDNFSNSTKEPTPDNNTTSPIQTTKMLDFLKSIGIDKHEKDEYIKPPQPQSISPNIPEATDADKLATKIYVIPMLDALKEKTEELAQVIKNTMTSSEQIDKETEKNVPDLLLRYNQASYSENVSILQKMGKVKEYEEIQAENECFKDYGVFLENRVESLKLIENTVKKTATSTTNFKDQLTSKLTELNKYYSQVRQQYDKAIVVEHEHSKVDEHRTIQLIAELKELMKVVDDFKKETVENEKKEADLNEKMISLQEQKALLLKEIDQHKLTIETCKRVTHQDLKSAYDYYQLVTKMIGVKVLADDNGVLTLDINPGLIVTINEKKLAEKKSDAVEIKIHPDTITSLGPFALWCRGFEPVIVNKWELTKIVETLMIYWNRVKMIRRELELIQRRFVTEIKPISNEEPKDCGVLCSITLFDLQSKTNINLTLEICVNEILFHPRIDISKIDINLEYGNITQVQLNRLVNKIFDKGIGNLSNKVADIFNRVTSAPPQL